MLGYVCKYTPMELFEAMDTEITRLEPSVCLLYTSPSPRDTR